MRFPFGTDYKLRLTRGLPDIDSTFAVETKPEMVLAWDLLKIVTTGQGVLWWAPTATEDIGERLMDGMTPQKLAELQGRLKSAIDQDPRFLSSSVEITMIKCDMRVRIEAQAADRSISLVLVQRGDGTIVIEEVSSDV